MDAADFGPSPVDAVTTFLISAAVVSVLFVVAALVLPSMQQLITLFPRCKNFFEAPTFQLPPSLLPALSSNLILHPAVPYLTENSDFAR